MPSPPLSTPAPQLPSYSVHRVHTQDLSPGEALWLWCCRVAWRSEKGAAIWHPLASLTTEEDAVALGSDLINWMTGTKHEARRKIRLSPPRCGTITCDERSLLAAAGSAQAGWQGRATAHLEWLLAGQPSPHLAETLGTLVMRFGCLGVDIPAPSAATPTPEAVYGHPVLLVRSK